MIIDFHTHVFPDEVADKAISSLTTKIDNIYNPVHNGTLSGLLKNMDSWGIDLSVVQPVMTKPSQVASINQYAASLCSNRIVSFGAIDPYSTDYKSQIDYVVEQGLKGIKFHPEYQSFIIDDAQFLKIYYYALSKDLILFFHAGADPGFSPPFKSSPKQFANIVDSMNGGIIIAAHFGGHAQWDEVEHFLAGKSIYLETSMGFEYYSAEQFINIKNKHGVDKILFGSDSPWSNAKTEVEHLRDMPLTENELNDILFNNAKRILNIK